jgi:hypothetical protein
MSQQRHRSPPHKHENSLTLQQQAQHHPLTPPSSTRDTRSPEGGMGYGMWGPSEAMKQQQQQQARDASSSDVCSTYALRMLTYADVFQQARDASSSDVCSTYALRMLTYADVFQQARDASSSDPLAAPLPAATMPAATNPAPMPAAGTQFTCFTGTKVQILTPCPQLLWPMQCAAVALSSWLTFGILRCQKKGSEG